MLKSIVLALVLSGLSASAYSGEPIGTYSMSSREVFSNFAVDAKVIEAGNYVQLSSVKLKYKTSSKKDIQESPLFVKDSDLRSSNVLENLCKKFNSSYVASSDTKIVAKDAGGPNYRLIVYSDISGVYIEASEKSDTYIVNSIVCYANK